MVLPGSTVADQGFPVRGGGASDESSMGTHYSRTSPAIKIVHRNYRNTYPIIVDGRLELGDRFSK